MTISFTKKPVYTFGGQEFETLEEAQIAAITAIEPELFAADVAKQILNNADALTAIFKQTPRKNASPRKRGPAKPRAAAKPTAATPTN